MLQCFPDTVSLKTAWLTQSPDLNPAEHHWDELQYKRQTRTPRLVSMSDLTNAQAADWTYISRAMLQNLVLALSEE